MNVYRVFTTRRDNSGKPIFINFGCDIPTLEEFVTALNRGRAIYGWNLQTRWIDDEHGKLLEIIGRTPYGLAPAGVESVENPMFRFVEFVE